jgi:hypothetical protein
MPYLGFTRSDLCSICAANSHADYAGTARSLLSADSHPLAGDDSLVPPACRGDHPFRNRRRMARDRPQWPAAGSGTMTVFATASDSYRADGSSSVDRAIRLSTAAAVLAVAGIAAYVSYWHAYAVVRAHGETGITTRLEPATIDGLVHASSMVVLYAARHRVPAPALARWLLGLGIAATLTANMAQGWSHGPVGAVVAAWPAVSLVGSYELLVWLIRTTGAVERGPSAEHLGEDAACRDAGCSAPVAAFDSEHRRNDRHLSAQGWRPDGQPATHASAQQDDRVAEADADNDAAVAAYRLSVQVGNPFSERKLAQTFGRTSRRWARARIAEARKSLPEREPAGLASIADGLPDVATDRAFGLAFRYGR